MTNDELINDEIMTNDELTNDEKMMNKELTNDEIMTNGRNPKQGFDLEERTGVFGENIILFAKRIKETAITRPLISQLVRAGTSIGANYCEADDAISRKDFFYKIGTSRKESRETKHWLRMIWAACPFLKEEARKLWKEAQELNLIFSSIFNKSKRKKQ